MIDIVNRLRFDATRCELQFSKGVAGNINAGADEIERLRSDVAEANSKLAALNLCDPHLLDRTLRERDALRQALSWLEDHEPQLVDAAREKFKIST